MTERMAERYAEKRIEIPFTLGYSYHFSCSAPQLRRSGLGFGLENHRMSEQGDYAWAAAVVAA